MPVQKNEGCDFVWLASDLTGNVAAFMTAGAGPVPLSAMNHPMVPAEDAEAAPAELPVVSAAQVLVDLKRR
jgi:hypothetical protein